MEMGDTMSELDRGRELTAQPQYTEQVVFLTTPEQAERVTALAKKRGVSKATIGREALNMALPKLEADLRRIQRRSDTRPTDEVRNGNGDH